MPLEKLVLPDRIELSTSPLPMECSTTELRQHARYPKNRPQKAPTGGRFLPQGPLWRKHAAGPGMAQNGQKMTPAAHDGGDPVPCRRHRRPEGPRTPESRPRIGLLPVPAVVPRATETHYGPATAT